MNFFYLICNLSRICVVISVKQPENLQKMKELVPIFVCCVLPVSIVLINAISKMNADNRRAHIIEKAIECGNSADTENLIEKMMKQRPAKTEREVRSLRLLRGCMFLLVGLVALVIAGIESLWGLFADPDFIYLLLLVGGFLAAIGISYLIVYRATAPTATDKE